jgi:NAD(P)-dependent dehydrogenase (short-subunit alcohol dehydrogenase family)
MVDTSVTMCKFQGVAVENAAYGITCNAVCPGYSLTPSTCADTYILESNFDLTAYKIQRLAIAICASRIAAINASYAISQYMRN